MWLMDKWEKWSQSQYDIWGSKLQNKYDFWNDYDDPELRKKCKHIWEALPKEIQKKIYNFLITILKKYGPEFAKQIIKGLSETFTGFYSIKNPA